MRRPGAQGGWSKLCFDVFGLTEEGLPQLRSRPVAETRSVLCRLKSMLGESHVHRLDAAAESYAYWWANEFSIEHDPSQVHGETNHFRYRPRPWHLLRFSGAWTGNCTVDSGLIALACQTVGTQLLLSSAELNDDLVKFAKSVGAKLVIETNEELVERLGEMKGGTLRFFGDCDRTQFSPASIGNLPILSSSCLANGRIELLNYLKEQSVSETVHRYGNLFE